MHHHRLDETNGHISSPHLAIPTDISYCTLPEWQPQTAFPRNIPSQIADAATGRQPESMAQACYKTIHRAPCRHRTVHRTPYGQGAQTASQHSEALSILAAAPAAYTLSRHLLGRLCAQGEGVKAAVELVRQQAINQLVALHKVLTCELLRHNLQPAGWPVSTGESCACAATT